MESDKSTEVFHAMKDGDVNCDLRVGPIWNFKRRFDEDNGFGRCVDSNVAECSRLCAERHSVSADPGEDR